MQTSLSLFGRRDSQVGHWRRAAALGIAALLAGVAFSVTPGRSALFAHADTPGGLPPTGTVGGADPPLTPFETLTLPGVLGDVQAVVYDGNQFLAGSMANTTMTGFSVPAAAKSQTTWVVADGQCGSDSPNGCRSTTPTAGSFDTGSFHGSGAPLLLTQDAFKGMGSDHQGIQDLNAGCPWGIPTSTVGSKTQSGDTCLWDTRTWDVSHSVLPGDASATANVTADGDCLNWEAQVFATAPAGAWATAGYVAHGKGLRNQGNGSIIVNDVPPGSKVMQALLYWNILNDTNPGGVVSINGQTVKGQGIGTAQSPCWAPTNSFAFRADVTADVAGNGDYNLSNYPTGDIDGHSPWISSHAPMMEGASLIIFYAAANTPGKVTGGGYIDPNGNLVGMADMIIQTGSANAGVNNHANFGFVVAFSAGDPSATGQLEYIDHAAGIDIKSVSMDLLLIGDGPCGANTHAAFTGQAALNGGSPGSFRVDVDDCGQPGSVPPDDFSISFQGIPPYAAGGPLVGGNIVIHKS